MRCMSEVIWEMPSLHPGYFGDTTKGSECLKETEVHLLPEGTELGLTSDTNLCGADIPF